MKKQKIQPKEIRYFIGEKEVTQAEDNSYAKLEKRIGDKMLETSGIKAKTYIPYKDMALSGTLYLASLATSPLWGTALGLCNILEDRKPHLPEKIAKGITTTKKYAELAWNMTGLPLYALEGIHTHYDISKAKIGNYNLNPKLIFSQNDIHMDSKKLTSLEILLPQGLSIIYGHRGHHSIYDHNIRFDTPFEQQDDSNSEFDYQTNKNKIKSFKTSMAPIPTYEGLENDIEKLREFQR